MQKAKYYNYTTNCPLNMESDGCDLDDWNRLYAESRFARHPKGFKIFLHPGRLSSSDEYLDSDPYNVEQKIENEFQEIRIELTIDLLQQAVSTVGGVPKILDLGCGEGHLTQKMRQSINSAELTGLDYSVSAIEYAHDHFPDIDFSVGDAYDAPYSKEYFDVVVCNNLWEHVPDPLNLLSTINRILKPGGYVIISTPSRYRLSNLARILMGKPVAFMSTHHVTEYSIGQVIEQFTYGGFQIEKILSRPDSIGRWMGRVVRRPVMVWISLFSSHHQLGSTVFYLAKKSLRNAEQGSV